MPLLHALAAFWFGAVLGSFLNVVILRYDSADALFLGRSKCPQCHQTLRWWELIPIFSFVFLQGACRRCRTSISVQYPLVEAVTAVTFLIVFLPLSQTLTAFMAAGLTAALISLLLVLFVIDLRAMVLPDVYILLVGVVAIALIALRLPAKPLEGVVVGAGFLLLLWMATRGQGIGFGDVKLMIPLGLLFGFPNVVVLLFAAFVSGGAVAAYLLLSGRADMKTAVPFGPYLIGAAWLLLLWPQLPAQFFSLLLP